MDRHIAGLPLRPTQDVDKSPYYGVTQVSNDAASHQSAIDAIKALMSPTAIAFIGVSSDPEKSSGQPIRNVTKVGYQGLILGVSRRGEPINRTEERRVGAECVSTGRSRGSRDH